MNRFSPVLYLVLLIAGFASGVVFAQEAGVSDVSREEAVQRVQNTLKEIQALQSEQASNQQPAVEAVMSTNDEAATIEQPLIVEDAVPVLAEPVPDKPVVAAIPEATEKKDTGNRFPFFPSQTKKDVAPNTVSPGVSKQAKKNFYQSAMTVSPLSFRDMVSIMATKKKVADGVSFDDAVEAMLFRANEVNFKNVGVNKLWLDVKAITGDEHTPRIEIYQFCDAMVARKILDYAPEFAIFLPCRVALTEDGKGALWVMTMDWDVTWLDYTQNANSVLDKELRENAIRIRNALEYIMEGAATGDF